MHRLTVSIKSMSVCDGVLGLVKSFLPNANLLHHSQASLTQASQIIVINSY